MIAKGKRDCKTLHCFANMQDNVMFCNDEVDNGRTAHAKVKQSIAKASFEIC